MARNIRDYENMHITLWLLKDTCWISGWHLGGMLMIVPTILVAFDITRRSRHNAQDFLVNLAVSLWICANAIWMIGEFYYNDTTRPYSIVFFVAGLAAITYYYIFVFPKRKDTAIETSEKQNASV